MRLLDEKLDPFIVRRSGEYWNLSDAYFAAKRLPGIVGRIDIKVYGSNLVMAVSTGWGDACWMEPRTERKEYLAFTSSVFMQKVLANQLGIPASYKIRIINGEERRGTTNFALVPSAFLLDNQAMSELHQVLQGPSLRRFMGQEPWKKSENGHDLIRVHPTLSKHIGIDSIDSEHIFGHILARFNTDRRGVAFDYFVDLNLIYKLNNEIIKALNHRVAAKTSESIATNVNLDNIGLTELRRLFESAWDCAIVRRNFEVPVPQTRADIPLIDPATPPVLPPMLSERSRALLNSIILANPHQNDI